MLLDQRAAHERLSRICHGDYDREIALVAERTSAGENELRILGASRMTKLYGANAARFSILISDCCQGLGIGGQILHCIIDVARKEKLGRLEAVMTPDNIPMQRLCQKYGFTFSQTEDKLIKAELIL